MMRRRLACCTRDREISIDFDQEDRIMTYDGLESCILNSHPYENESGTSRENGCVTDSLDGDDSSCSSSTNAFGSFSSHWTMMKKDEQGPDEWELSDSPRHFCMKEKPAYAIEFSDVETMKERFAKLLLGEDITGGRKGVSAALALSNAITSLAASVFGELWKLEPLPEERKSKWQREMDWLLSPTNYMVELVPAKQYGANGRSLEIMTPKARADIHMNLPALQKLDSMLIETLDSMVSADFWYEERGSRAEGRSSGPRQSKRWWLPSPRVPISGLSDTERKKLLSKGKLVQQVFKAAKSINESVLLEMPVPTIIREALPKSGRSSLGEEMYKILTGESKSVKEMMDLLNLKTEHKALEAINRLETAAFAWRERINEQSNSNNSSGKSPARRTSWSSIIKDPISEMDKTEFLLKQAESLLQQLKTTYPNLPQTFLDVTKIQYGKDVGHSILEAYSRVIANLAFSILSRIRDIIQEDISSDANSPASNCSFSASEVLYSPVTSARLLRHSLLDQMNGQFSKVSDCEDEPKLSSVTATPSRSRVWCIGREACSSVSANNSP
ncbi:hypothetical protein LguiA_033730 [Lonicera macranthoides]